MLGSPCCSGKILKGDSLDDRQTWPEVWAATMHDKNLKRTTLPIVSCFYLLFTDVRGVPGEVVGACVLVSGHQYRLASVCPVFAHKADDALVPEAAIGRTLVSALIGQLHHLVQVGQLPADLPRIHRSFAVFNAHSCTQTDTQKKN